MTHPSGHSQEVAETGLKLREVVSSSFSPLPILGVNPEVLPSLSAGFCCNRIGREQQMFQAEEMEGI